MSNGIEKSATSGMARSGRGDVVALVESMRGQIERALPAHVTADRMTRILLTAIRKNPDLGRCSRESMLAAVMDLSSIGLEPNSPLGHAYLIPRNGKHGWEVTTILGYQGLLDLARRSGSVRSIYAHVAREGDLFEYELGLRQDLRHRPTAKSSAPVTHAYAVAHLVGDADPIFVVLTRDEVEARRKRGANGPAWRTDWEAMAKKSAIRALWPWLPRSAEMARAAELDDEGEGVTVGGAYREEPRSPRMRALDLLEADVEPAPAERVDGETAPADATTGDHYEDDESAADDFVDG